ncbi:hypothetical protein GCM10009855_08280 [Gordonia cholesterolivorans]|uniref:Uncharacterized protein n=1 Tax=Gordonia cholesterolivorans TaxID=559625 RepID=A0ABN3H7A7_9ACTN
MCTPLIAEPIVIGSPAASGSVIVTITVVSVGPYALRSLPPQRATSSGGHTSPPTTTRVTRSSSLASTVCTAFGAPTKDVIR